MPRRRRPNRRDRWQLSRCRLLREVRFRLFREFLLEFFFVGVPIIHGWIDTSGGVVADFRVAQRNEFVMRQLLRLLQVRQLRNQVHVEPVGVLEAHRVHACAPAVTNAESSFVNCLGENPVCGFGLCRLNTPTQKGGRPVHLIAVGWGNLLFIHRGNEGPREDCLRGLEDGHSACWSESRRGEIEITRQRVVAMVHPSLEPKWLRCHVKKVNFFTKKIAYIGLDFRQNHLLR